MTDYTTVGTHTFTAAADGVHTITLFGNGGAGEGGIGLGAGGHGGGGAAKVVHLVYLTAGQQLSLVISAAAAGGAFGSGADGATGADVTCTLLDPGPGPDVLIARAKGGGGGGIGGVAGVGGQAASCVGDAATSGSNGVLQSAGGGGNGGAAAQPGGGAGGTTGGNPGAAGTAPGGGGKGGNNTTGGAGGAGALGKASVVAGQPAISFPLTTAGTTPYIVETAGDYYLEGYAGGGGGEGGITLTRGGSGGGGGGYSGRRYTLAVGDKLLITVGAGGSGGAHGGTNGSAGIDTTVTLNGVTILRAKAGSGGADAGGPGGVAADGIGDDRYGGSAGVLPSGATIFNGGTGGTAGGPAGGAGGVNGGQLAGVAGTAPGGGGSGGGVDGAGVGGAGATGRFSMAAVATDVNLAGGRYETAITSAGFTTYRAPDYGYLLAVAVGAGSDGATGAFGAGGGGGASGGLSWAIVKCAKDEEFLAEVGAGGPTGAGSSFKRGTTTTLVSANGAPAASAGTGGAMGSIVGAVGDVKLPGQRGGNRSPSASNRGGMGAPAPLPKGLKGSLQGEASGVPGQNGFVPGGGGGGGSGWTGSEPAGKGAQGGVYLLFLQTFGTTKVDGVEEPFIRAVIKEAGVEIELKPSIKVAGVEVPFVRLLPDPDGGYRARPSWVPVGHEKKFNREFGTFNWKESNTANLRTGLAAALSGGSTSWVVPGDSQSEGWISLNPITLVGVRDFLQSWPIKAMEYINTLNGTPIAGTGLVKPTTVAGPDPRWSHGGGVTQNGHYLTLANGQTSTFTANRAGTRAAVAYFNRPGDTGFTVSIDGGAAVTVTPNGAGGVARYEVTGLANTTHTVAITGGAGGNARVCGAEVYSPSGIRAHVVAQGGSTVIAGDPAQKAWGTTSLGLGGLGPTFSDYAAYGSAPSMAPIFMGANDVAGTTIPATATYDAIEASLRNTIIPAFGQAGTDVALVPIFNPSNLFSATGATDLLRDRFYEIAVDLDLPLIDMEFLAAGYAGLDSRNYIGDEYGHTSVAGATYVGQKFAQAFLSTEFYTP